MEFEDKLGEDEQAPGQQHKKKKNKKKKNKKKRRMIQETIPGNMVEELEAFLYLLDMEDQDDDEDSSHCTRDTGNVPWTADKDKELLMTSNFISSLAALGQRALESEFYIHFSTHMAWKRFLVGPEMKRLKERIFFLMAKEKEVEGHNSTQKLLFEHFLYEELRLQHQLITTPLTTDTPNEIAFKAAMIPVICGLIRNLNESRSTKCLEILDDEEESKALLLFEMSSPGSCLRSILQPLYRAIMGSDGEIDIKRNANVLGRVELLPIELRTLCFQNCNTSDGVVDSGASEPIFFDGPPEWHFNLPLFMKRIAYSEPSAEKSGFIRHSLRKAQEIRIMQDYRLFYDVAYGNGRAQRFGSSSEATLAESYELLMLPFTVHIMLHRASYAVVGSKPHTVVPDDSELLTLPAFRQLVNVVFPHIIAAPCKKCSAFCTGECVCGTRYCSAICRQSDNCEGCSQGCPDAFKYLTPVSWGRPPL